MTAPLLFAWAIVSTVLNVLLAVAVFLKPALNDILVQTVKARRERVARTREVVSELHYRLDAYPVQWALGNSILVAPADWRQQFDDMREKATATQDFVARNEFELPSAIRVGITRLRNDGFLGNRLAETDLEMSKLWKEASKAVAEVRALTERELAGKVR